MLEQLRKFHEPWNRHPRVPDWDFPFDTNRGKFRASDKTLTMKMNEKMLVLPSDRTVASDKFESSLGLD